jgi:hypothetical protein
MKATHLRTPRTLDECRFETDGQAIFKISNTGMEDFENIKSAAFIIGGFALFLIIFYIFKS